jgi:hypothetical protein
MVIDWVALINKVPEMVLLVVFIWFTLKMLETSSKNAKDIMDDWKLYLSDQNERWRKYFKQRDDVYLAKLEATGDRHAREIEVISKDIQEQTGVLTKMVEQMAKHDELLKFIAEDVRERRSAN